MTIELSEKAKENLQRNAESRKKDSNYVKLEPGEKTTLHFDPEKIEPVDSEFDFIFAVISLANLARLLSLLVDIFIDFLLFFTTLFVRWDSSRLI